jgi:hypothetical protein
MSSVQYNNYEQVGEEIGRMFIRFKYYSPPKKIAVLCFMFFICGLPYYLIFYKLVRRYPGNLLRGNESL